MVLPDRIEILIWGAIVLISQEILERYPVSVYQFMGRLRGCNRPQKYADRPNVILAGTLFLRPSQYEALGRAAAGLHSSDGPFPADASEAVRRGEHRHFILQAACRGAIRKCVGNKCPPANLYIIASRRSHNLRAVQSEIASGEWMDAIQAGDRWAGYAIAKVMGLDMDNKADRALVRECLKVWKASGMFRVETRNNEKREPRNYLVVGEWASDLDPSKD